MSRNKASRDPLQEVVVIDSDDEQPEVGLGGHTGISGRKLTPNEFPVFSADVESKPLDPCSGGHGLPKEDFCTWLDRQLMEGSTEKKKSLDSLKTSLFPDDDVYTYRKPESMTNIDNITSYLPQLGVAAAAGHSRSSGGLFSPTQLGTGSTGTKAAATAGITTAASSRHVRTMPKIAPVGGLSFSPVQRRAGAMAGWGGRDTEQEVTGKRQKYEQTEQEYLVKEMCAAIVGRTKFDVHKACKDLSRSDSSIRSYIRGNDVMRHLSSVAGMRAAPALELVDGRGVAEALKNGLDVKEHPKIFVDFFKCCCGGDVKCSKTTEANKKKYGFTNDYWIHCSKYFDQTKPCNRKYKIEDLVVAVATAQLDSCRE